MKRCGRYPRFFMSKHAGEDAGGRFFVICQEIILCVLVWDQQKNQKGDSETAAARERNRKKIAPEKVVDCGDEIDNHVFKNPHFKIFSAL